jgi:hypothetical protein
MGGQGYESGHQCSLIAPMTRRTAPVECWSCESEFMGGAGALSGRLFDVSKKGTVQMSADRWFTADSDDRTLDNEALMRWDDDGGFCLVATEAPAILPVFPDDPDSEKAP